MIDERNSYVHGVWVETLDVPKEVGLFVTRAGEQRYEPEFDPVPLDKIQKVVMKLRELQEEAQRLTDILKGRQPNEPILTAPKGVPPG